LLNENALNHIYGGTKWWDDMLRYITKLLNKPEPITTSGFVIVGDIKPNESKPLSASEFETIRI